MSPTSSNPSPSSIPDDARSRHVRRFHHRGGVDLRLHQRVSRQRQLDRHGGGTRCYRPVWRCCGQSSSTSSRLLVGTAVAKPRQGVVRPDVIDPNVTGGPAGRPSYELATCGGLRAQLARADGGARGGYARRGSGADRSGWVSRLVIGCPGLGMTIAMASGGYRLRFDGPRSHDDYSAVQLVSAAALSISHGANDARRRWVSS